MKQEGAPAIDWIHIRAADPRAVLFVPPLIGGHHAQQVRHFRRLIRRGYDLVSFNYAGHGDSAGKFSLEAALTDTRAALQRAAAVSQREGLPLYGIGVCYPAIPLLACAARFPGVFHKIVLVNAIMGLRPRAIIRSFFDYYSELRRTESRVPRIAEAFHRYADFIFPGVTKSRHRFGVLHRQRTRLLKTLWDALFLDPLADVHLPRTPVLCLYSTHDRILQITENVLGDRYQQDVRRICPLAIFRPLAADHFLSHPDARSAAFGDVLAFLGEI
jgi:pimeloyl-ACP methyl ester carboxylesterase